MENRNKKLIYFLISILIFINFNLPYYLYSFTDNSLIGRVTRITEYDWGPESIYIDIFQNGSLKISIRAMVAEFTDVSDVTRGLFIADFMIKRSRNARLNIIYDLTKISACEADSYALKIAERFQSLFGGRFKLINRNERSFVSPVSGEMIHDISYTYDFYDIDLNRVIDLFMKFKFNDGFMALVNSHNVWNFRLIDFQFGFNRFGSFYYGAKILFYFNNYYKFKSGNSYTFDLFDILNFTGTLIAKAGSWINIFLHKPYDMDFIITRAELPPQMVISKGGDRAIEIGNVMKPFESDQVIDKIYLRFKAVERGLKLPYFSINILVGLIILLSTMGIVLFLLHKFGILSRFLGLRNRLFRRSML